MKILPTIISLGACLLIIFGCNKIQEKSAVNPITKREAIESAINELQQEVSDSLELNLELAGYKNEYPKEIIILAFKEEQNLQVYAKTDTAVKLIKNYQFHGFSGKLGPKLKQFDLQIPEGIYRVEFLNPNSSYHLSIKVSYPNAFDISKSKFTKIEEMGGDIFIHGKSSTIGCIPIGDEGIEEVFLLAEKALSNEIKVIISPWDFRRKSEYPEIDNIDWEDELYDMISEELISISTNKGS